MERPALAPFHAALAAALRESVQNRCMERPALAPFRAPSVHSPSPSPPPSKRRPTGIKHRAAGPYYMSGSVPCPFCGGRALPRRPGLERLSGSTITVGPASLNLAVGPSGEEYYSCRGCNMAFVFADRDIKALLPGLAVDSNIPTLISHYYGDGVSARDLLAEHSTAVVRKVRPSLSFLSPSAARNELVVCFNYRSVRTFGSLRRRKGKRGYRYYSFEELIRT